MSSSENSSRHMIERIFVIEFFKNPFFWWSIFLGVLILFYSYTPFNQTLQVIITQSLYIPVLFICLTIAMFLILFPIRKNVKTLLLKKGTKLEGLLIFSLVFLVLVVSMVFFLSDPGMIITTIDKQVIADKQQLNEALSLKILFEYIGVPLFYAFELTIIKRGLIRNGLTEEDSIKNNIKFGLCLTALGVGMYYLHGFFISLM